MDCVGRTQGAGDLCSFLVPGRVIGSVSIYSEYTCRHLHEGLFVIVLTLTHGYNAVRGHRTGSNNSGAEEYLSK